jgi:hypothetical protein
MRWISRRLGLTWDVIGCVAFGGGSLLNFYDYRADTQNAHLIAGVVFGLLCVVKVLDIFANVSRKRL